MAQSHDRLHPPDLKPSGAWGGFAAKQRTNQSAMNSWHSGTSAPADPETHQRWLDTSVTPALLKIYSGSAWVLMETYVAIFKEIADARGSAASVNARMAVALAADGTLIPAASFVSDEFKAIAGTYTRTGASTFTVTGDKTAIFVARRRVKMVGSTTTYSEVSSSVFGSVTTVTIVDANVPTAMTADTTAVGMITPTAASTALGARGISSPSGGYAEDYLAEIVTARAGQANLNARLTRILESGVAMLFKQNAAPTGWTRYVAAGETDSAIIARTNSEAPGTGGSWTVSGLTFAGSALAGHAHTAPVTVSADANGIAYGTSGGPFGTGVPVARDSKASGVVGPQDNAAGWLTNSISAGTPAGTVSQDGAWRPKYIETIIATKD